MDAEEITGAFDKAIREAVSEAGAKFDAETGTRVANMTRTAGWELAMRPEPEMQEEAVETGIAAYQRLVHDAVAAARQLQQYPSLGKFALDTALRRTGPNPPFWAD
ncbi:MAG: hypothetical protein JO276_00405 [Sphingomonadaceae bacterium]|nr:hypothetical protein [Sphingomonadaceae bacterium]